MNAGTATGALVSAASAVAVAESSFPPSIFAHRDRRKSTKSNTLTHVHTYRGRRQQYGGSTMEKDSQEKRKTTRNLSSKQHVNRERPCETHYSPQKVCQATTGSTS